jgi:hypothetical protein
MTTTRCIAGIVIAGAGCSAEPTRITTAPEVTYRGKVDVRPVPPGMGAVCGTRTPDGTPCSLTGFVFEDTNRDAVRQEGEPGIADVAVSNGLEVVTTGEDGSYVLPVFTQQGGTTIFVTKPAAFMVPVDGQNIPQFSYNYVPDGSPPLLFGGLEPSGPLPAQINFPMLATPLKNRFKVIVSGDTQPNSQEEIGFVRDTLVRDIAAAGTDDIEFLIVEGDLVSDELSFFPRFKEVMKLAHLPFYFVGGNHDIDWDATDDAFSFDTFRREFGPPYYSFELGQVHFIVLDDIHFPCTLELDNVDGRHGFCADPVGSPAFTAGLGPVQLEWLRNDLERVPLDKLVVLNMHVPLVSFLDQNQVKHQVHDTPAVYQLLQGRKALALSGHTHTFEHHRPGDLYAGWQTTFAAPHGPIPFPQIVTGAACGAWWQGAPADDGAPESIDRFGTPRGYLVFEFDGSDYSERFRATGQSPDKQMSVSLLSPTFREWDAAAVAWLRSDPATRGALPALPDASVVTTADVAGGVELVANVWNGSRESSVYVEFDDAAPLQMQRVQSSTGEGILSQLDPHAIRRQIAVGTVAALTRSSPHIWRLPLPELPLGAHSAHVRTVDVHGAVYEELIAFEVADVRPSLNP